MGPFAQKFYEDEDIAIYGMWTTNNFRVQSGELRKKDINELKEKFSHVPDHKIKIIACHHPVGDPLLSISPDFILWGHEHQSGVKKIDGTFMLAAGTSTSSRTRSEANSFNYISIDDDKLKIEVYLHSKSLKAFEVIDSQEFTFSS